MIESHLVPSAQQLYTMLGSETLWETAALCDRVLSEAEVAYSVCGGVVVCLHGYQRNTVGLDLVVSSADANRVRQLLEDAGLTWHQDAAEFRTEAGIAVQFLIAGESAGRGSGVKIPEAEGDDNVERIEGLSVLSCLD